VCRHWGIRSTTPIWWPRHPFEMASWFEDILDKLGELALVVLGCCQELHGSFRVLNSPTQHAGLQAHCSMGIVSRHQRPCLLRDKILWTLERLPSVALTCIVVMPPSPGDFWNRWDNTFRYLESHLGQLNAWPRMASTTSPLFSAEHGCGWWRWQLHCRWDSQRQIGWGQRAQEPTGTSWKSAESKTYWRILRNKTSRRKEVRKARTMKGTKLKLNCLRIERIEDKRRYSRPYL